MSLTGAHITAALKSVGAGSGTVMTPAKIAAAFNDAMFKYGDGLFDNQDKVAALLAESIMESAYFRTTQEYSEDGPYMPYSGRTFIQITWKKNYGLFGAWCKSEGLITDPEFFVKFPKELANLEWAAIGAVWYFTKVLFNGKPLTDYAHDMGKVGRAVNLGDPESKYIPNGQADRETAYAAVRKLGSAIVPDPPVIVPEAKELIVATGKSIRLRNNTKQSLKIGDQLVKIKKGTTDLSVAFGPSDGVDVVAALQFENPGKYTISAFWRVEDLVTGGSTTVTGVTIPQQAVGVGRQTTQVLFKGALPKSTKANHNIRLRLCVRVDAVKLAAGEKAPALPTVSNIYVDGWSL